MTTALTVYLQDHEAAAQAGLDLFRRTAATQRRRSYGADLAVLRDEVAEDLAALRRVLQQQGVRPAPLLGLGLRLAERLGRLKPNGGLVRRMPLSDLIEIEGLADAVHAKSAGWRALRAAGVGEPVELDRLTDRATDQLARLAGLHAVAASVLVA